MSTCTAGEQIEGVCNSLTTMPADMRLFSLSLRSLYAEKALSGDTKESTELLKLRDDTRRDANTYVSGILPICTNAVRGIKDYFENYQVLTIDEWRDELPSLIKEVDGYIQVCQVTENLHKGILVPLKKRQDQAKILLSKIETLNSEYDENIAKLREGADDCRWWALCLGFVPVVNAVATPLLLADAKSTMARAIAATTQKKMNNAACVAIRDALIPALTNFIVGLEAIGGFFCALKEDLISFQSRGKDAMDAKMLRHYKLMKKEADDVMKNCRLFFAVIPGMETDLAAIPYEDTDGNYVKKWLKEKEAEIRKEYSGGVSSSLEKVLMSINLRGSRKALTHH